MRDYNGQKIFIGIDVHKNSYSVTAVMDQQAIKKTTIAASPEILVACCEKYFSGAIIQSAYEAGFWDLAFIDFLKKMASKIRLFIQQALR